MPDPFNITQIGRDALTHGKNELKSFGHGLVQEFVAPQEMNKSFIHIRDFYNFIRATSANVPAPFFYFCPNFYAFDTSVDMLTSVTVDRGKAVLQSEPKDKTARSSGKFFESCLGDFARFRYCIQGISFPALRIQGYESGTGGGGAAYKDLTNIYGGHSIISNSYLNAEQHTLEMNVLNTQKPIVENFIYPWLMEVLRTNIVDKPIPRVNMAVKYWSPDRITWDMEGVKPDFVYYVTGMFPVRIDTWNPKQAVGDSDIQRKVVFAFNDFVILNSYADAVKYNLVEFFVGNAINNALTKGRQWLDRKIDEWVDKIGKKKKKKKKNKGGSSTGGGGGCCSTSSMPESPLSQQSNKGGGNDDGGSEPENPNDSNDNNNNASDMSLDEAMKSADRQISDNSFTPIVESSNEANTAKEKGVTRSSTISSVGGQSRPNITSTTPTTNRSTVSSSTRPSFTSTTPVNSRDSLRYEVKDMNLDEPVTMEEDSRADSSNMTLDENIQMFNILNADEEFPEIIDADDEADHAQDTRNVNALKRTMTEVDPNAGDTMELLHETTVASPTPIQKTMDEIDVDSTPHNVISSTTKGTTQLHRNLLNNHTSTPASTSSTKKVNNATLGVSTDRSRLTATTPIKQQTTVQTNSDKLPEDYKNVENAPTVKRTDSEALKHIASYEHDNDDFDFIIPESDKIELTNVKENNGSMNVERHQDVSKNIQVNPTDVDFKVSGKKPVSATDVNYQIDKSKLSHYISQEALRKIRPNDGDNAVDTKAYKDIVVSKTGIDNGPAQLDKEVYQDLLTKSGSADVNNSRGNSMFEPPVTNEEDQQKTAEVNQLTLEDSIRLMNAKRTDEDFGEVIDADDELDITRSKAADKTFKSLASDSSLFSAEDQLQPAQRDYSSIRTMLMSTDSLNGMKYGIIKEYADTANVGLKEALQEYKSNRTASVDKIVNTLKQKDSYALESHHDDEKTKAQVEAMKRNDGTYGKVTIENYKIKPPENMDNEVRKQDAIRAAKQSGKVETAQIKHQRPQLTASDIEDIF